MYLSDFTLEDLHKKVNCFLSNDFSSMSPVDIYQQVANLFAIDGEINWNIFKVYLPVPQCFYRVRKIRSLKDLSTEQGFWGNPSPQLGRLNCENEPLLYACLESSDCIETAMLETGVNPNDLLAIICYESLETITYAPIGLINSGYEVDPSEYEKHLLVERFLEQVFTQEVLDKNQNYYYHMARAIGTFYFGFGKDSRGTQFCDAILYPSTKNNAYINLCFQAESATRKIKLRGAAIAKAGDNSQRKLLVEQFALRNNGHTLFLDASEDLFKYIMPFSYKYKKI